MRLGQLLVSKSCGGTSALCALVFNVFEFIGEPKLPRGERVNGFKSLLPINDCVTLAIPTLGPI
jgi:hypothetical protein